jgi:hypothetical protein
MLSVNTIRMVWWLVAGLQLFSIPHPHRPGIEVTVAIAAVLIIALVLALLWGAKAWRDNEAKQRCAIHGYAILGTTTLWWWVFN